VSAVKNEVKIGTGSRKGRKKVRIQTGMKGQKRQTERKNNVHREGEGDEVAPRLRPTTIEGLRLLRPQ